ncbi:MAG: aromatic acid exporter family protein [Eubacteriales bacterium]|nr:aromatic acid exporter family protein [Eubacteriales bacterium]
MEKKELKKLLLRTAKIAVGSSIAIYAAELLHLEYAASAGSIALLTLVTTKWETLKLSAFRVITFAAAVILAWIAFVHLNSEWVAYGTFIFVLVLLSEILNLKATISVNAVIGTHFLATHDFSLAFVKNEFLLVLIGISVAIVLNLFHDNHNRKKDIIRNMRRTEQQLQEILREMASYLLNQETERNVWEDICSLEEQLHGFSEDAHEYQNNTFQSHPGYYIDYFEMRMKQCNMLHNLHYEMKKIRTMPGQAEIIAHYILYLADYVVEVNVPTPQLERLQGIFKEMEKEPLPVTREEFESRAMLYHILMDLEEFLIVKKRFVNELDERQMQRYWKKDRTN